MVLIPRAAPVHAPANVANARLGPASRVVSYAGSSVEELPEGTTVSFDSGQFGFRQDAPSSFNHNAGHEQPTPHHQTGRLNAPSQTFAAMLEFPETTDGGNRDAAGNGPATPYPGVVARAIEIYETNAKIVSGENNILGTSVSLVL